MPAFAAAVERYALSWAQRLYTAWAERPQSDAPPWLSTLSRLCGALVSAGEQASGLAHWLFEREVASFKLRHVGVLGLPAALFEHGEQRQVDDLLVLLEAAATIGAKAVRDDLVAFLSARAIEFPFLTPGSLLERLVESRSAPELRALGVGTLHRHVVESLERAVEAEPRSLWARCTAALGCSPHHTISRRSPEV